MSDAGSRDTLERRPNLGQERRAFRGQRDAMAETPEQRGSPQSILEQADLSAYRAMCDPEFRRGFLEAAPARGRLEGPDGIHRRKR